MIYEKWILFFKFGIADAGMINCFQFLFEHRFHDSNVLGKFIGSIFHGIGKRRQEWKLLMN